MQAKWSKHPSGIPRERRDLAEKSCCRGEIHENVVESEIQKRRPPIGRGAILVALSTGALLGCTREFYREWANQDVSEAVFEKSRDPRWRIDLFSVEPPMLSRFADPYDQDVPPAPPDDPAAEALSPVPQWPDNRLLLPVEGTGYLDLLEYWRRDAAAKAAAAGQSLSSGRTGVLAAPGQRPSPDNRPATAGHAWPAAGIASWPAGAT